MTRDVGALLQDAVGRHQGGDPAAAVPLYLQALEQVPDQPDALHFLGLAYHQLGRRDEALRHLSRSIECNPRSAEFHANFGQMLYECGMLDDAIARLRAGLAVNPDMPGALNTLGIAQMRTGMPADAVVSLRAAVAARPSYGEAWNNLGTALRRDGDLEAAADAHMEALRLRPDFVAARVNLGDVLQGLGRLEEAVEAYKVALAFHADFPLAHNNLAGALQKQGQLDDAIRHYEAAIAAAPDYVEAHSNLGSALEGSGRFEAAEAAYRKAIAINPEYAWAHTNLGSTLKSLGRLEAAAACHRKALSLDPTLVDAHSNLIFLLDFDPAADVAAQQAERRRWAEAHAGAVVAATDHANDRDPDRPLRVGYVSADFRHHSAARSFGPVVLNHTAEAVETVCYSTTLRHDDMTERFRAAAAEWHEVIGLTDDALAAKIRDDRIDILVDLPGHTAGNRLLAFARKPAPLQVSGWGSATGTGLAAMDYLMSDAVVVPDDEAHLYAEEIVHLPCYMGYLAPEGAPKVAPPPSVTSGHVTFGCFNRSEKLTPASLGLWADILRRAPDARLLLKAREYEDAAVRDAILRVLGERGVAAERIEFAGNTSQGEHLAALARVDVVLDPTPHGGGISTFEALWMGVPVVTLLGDTVVGRASGSILIAAVLEEMVAVSADGYRETALRLAADQQGLAAWRGKLREAVATSPMGDAGQYVAAVESAYRRIWKNWCGAESQVSVSANRA